MDTKTGSISLLFTRNTLQPKRQTFAILISNIIDLKLESIKRDGEGHFILITGTIHQDGVSFLNIYDPNIKALTHVKETFLEIKAYIKPHTLIVGDFNT